MYRLGLYIIFSAIIGLVCHAEDKIDLQKIYNEAQGSASGARIKLDSLSSGNNIPEVLQNTERGIRNQAEELGRLPQAGEKEKEKIHKSEKGMCTKDGCNVSQVMSSKSINKREVELEKLGFRKDKDRFAEDNKGYLDKVEHNAKKYKDKFDAISGTYKDCKPTIHENSYKEKKECDEYYDVKYKNCPINQVVEIDPKYTYQCSKKRDEAIKTCYDEVVLIKCKESAECDNNGIILSTVDTNLQEQEFVYPRLYVGTPYWAPHFCTVDSTKYTTFEVKNVDKVQSFVLEKVRFDDYIMIKLNDNLVYHGPDSQPGEDRIELVRPGRRGTITTDGKNRKGCERATDWVLRPNIEMKQYLKEGVNRISITIATAGFGQGQLWIKTTQHCCKEWDIRRESKCTYDEVAQ